MALKSCWSQIAVGVYTHVSDAQWTIQEKSEGAGLNLTGSPLQFRSYVETSRWRCNQESFMGILMQTLCRIAYAASNLILNLPNNPRRFICKIETNPASGVTG